MRCNLGAMLCDAVRRPGRLAPGLLAFGAAVRLMEILLRRAAQWFLTWWTPIRAVHHVTRLCTTWLARCGVQEHRALHTVRRLNPAQFSANLARGMEEGAVDAGRAGWGALSVQCAVLEAVRAGLHSPLPVRRPRHHPGHAVRGGAGRSTRLGGGVAVAANI